MMEMKCKMTDVIPHVKARSMEYVAQLQMRLSIILHEMVQFLLHDLPHYVDEPLVQHDLSIHEQHIHGHGIVYDHLIDDLIQHDVLQQKPIVEMEQIREHEEQKVVTMALDLVMMDVTQCVKPPSMDNVETLLLLIYMILMRDEMHYCQVQRICVCEMALLQIILYIHEQRMHGPGIVYDHKTDDRTRCVIPKNYIVEMVL